MTEQDKVTVDDIIGIVKTEEQTNSVALKKEAQLSICEKRLIELEKENEQLKCGNKNLKSILNDFINILNRLQSNPNDKQTLGVARDMLQNMGVDLE